MSPFRRQWINGSSSSAIERRPRSNERSESWSAALWYTFHALNGQPSMNEKRILILATLIALAIAAFVATGVDAQSNGSAPATGLATASAPQSVEKKAEEQFKNIQVLKGIPADQLIPSMQFITASLGV